MLQYNTATHRTGSYSRGLSTNPASIANSNINPEKRRLEGQATRVPGASLLWKKREQDGTYTEQWMFVTKDLKSLINTKRAIISRTDIPTNGTVSEDGKQSFVMEQFGDLVYITISGLSR